MTEKTDVVPFGKYRGQPVDVLQQDQDYCEWLLGQGWMQSRYPELRTIIINNFHEPEETPEHNSLQARFLDRGFVSAFCKAAGIDDNKSVTFEQCGADVVLAEQFASFVLGVEIKPSMGDDYPSVMRQILAMDRRVSRRFLVLGEYNGIGATIEQVRGMFKASRITLVTVSEIESNL
ncbi:MAG: hypothetical protein K9L88_07985 [Chromatiaceae bacterium]|nr:hypothetical protein [Chromatiaceae bacterium]